MVSLADWRSSIFFFLDEEYWTPFKGVILAQQYQFLILCSVAAYIPVIILLQWWMTNRRPMNTRGIGLIWDFSLSSLSLWGAIVVLSYDGKILLKSFAPDETIHPYTRATLCLFCLTKCVEFGDTLLLVLKKKPLILLHVWHHISVTLYCWHAQLTDVPFAHRFAFMNLSIHAVMYLYYGVTSLAPRHPWVRAARPYITMSQTLQMFAGMYLSQAAIASDVPSEMQKFNAKCALAMYATYAYLFAKLYIESYFKHLRATMVLVVSTVFLSSAYGLLLLGYKLFYGVPFQWLRMIGEVLLLSTVTSLVYSWSTSGPRNPLRIVDGSNSSSKQPMDRQGRWWVRVATASLSFLVELGVEAGREAEQRIGSLKAFGETPSKSSKGNEPGMEKKRPVTSSPTHTLERREKDKCKLLSTGLCRSLLMQQSSGNLSARKWSRDASLCFTGLVLPMIYGWLAYGDIILGLCVHGGVRWALELFAVEGIANYIAPSLRQIKTDRED